MGGKFSPNTNYGTVMKNFVIGAILSFLSAAPLAAQDRIPVLKSSAFSGSERLALYSFTEHFKTDRSVAVLNAVNSRMQRLAFPIFETGTPQTGLLLKTGRVSPILSYDDNINGGNRSSDFDVGGFTFSGDPKFLAKEGVVIGGEVGGTLRYAYGRGRYFDLSGGLSAVYSPRHEISKYAIGVSACSRNHIQGWTFVDFCARGNKLFTELDTSTSHAISTTGTQLFSFAGFDHEASIGVRQSFYDSYDQTIASFELTTSLGRPGSVSLGVEVGEHVNGANALMDRIVLGYRTEVLNRPVSFSMSRSVFDGSSFFGLDREDKNYGLSVKASITRQISLGISARRNESTVEFFSYDSISLDLGIAGFTF